MSEGTQSKRRVSWLVASKEFELDESDITQPEGSKELKEGKSSKRHTTATKDQIIEEIQKQVIQTPAPKKETIQKEKQKRISFALFAKQFQQIPSPRQLSVIKEVTSVGDSEQVQFSAKADRYRTPIQMKIIEEQVELESTDIVLQPQRNRSAEIEKGADTLDEIIIQEIQFQNEHLEEKDRYIQGLNIQIDEQIRLMEERIAYLDNLSDDEDEIKSEEWYSSEDSSEEIEEIEEDDDLDFETVTSLKRNNGPGSSIYNRSLVVRALGYRLKQILFDSRYYLVFQLNEAELHLLIQGRRNVQSKEALDIFKEFRHELSNNQVSIQQFIIIFDEEIPAFPKSTIAHQIYKSSYENSRFSQQNLIFRFINRAPLVVQHLNDIQEWVLRLYQVGAIYKLDLPDLAIHILYAHRTCIDPNNIVSSIEHCTTIVRFIYSLKSSKFRVLESHKRMEILQPFIPNCSISAEIAIESKSKMPNDLINIVKSEMRNEKNILYVMRRLNVYKLY